MKGVADSRHKYIISYLFFLLLFVYPAVSVIRNTMENHSKKNVDTFNVVSKSIFILIICSSYVL